MDANVFTRPRARQVLSPRLWVKTVAQNLSLAHDDFMLADEQTGPEQFAALRAMTGAHRLRLAERLYWSARKMKAAGLRSQHPDWPEQRLRDEVRRIFSHART